MQATCSQPVAMPNLTANVPTVDAVRMHSGLADDWDEHTESNILAAFDPAHEEHGHDMTAVTEGSDDDRHAAAMGEDEEQTVKFGLGALAVHYLSPCSS